MERDAIEREVWRGAQVKSSSVSGSLTSATGLRSIITQLEAALEIPYVDTNGRETRLQEIYLITPSTYLTMPNSPLEVTLG